MSSNSTIHRLPSLSRKRRGRSMLTVSGLAVLALVTAGCGSSSDTPSAVSSTSPTPTTAMSGDALGVATTSLGKVVVDSSGYTVYLLTSDSPNTSNCSAGCLAAWPPVPPASSGKATAPGVTAKVGETQTTTGETMLTVNGWPVYRYVGDTAPGEVAGQGIASYGGVWYALSPNGKPIQQTSPGPASSSPDSGSGYSY